MKLNNTNFIIIGSNSNNGSFCYQSFKLENNKIIQDNDDTGLNLYFRNLIKLEGRYIQENKLIIYTLESRNFNCYLINMKEKQYSLKEIGTIPDTIQEDDYKYVSYVKCDSVEGINFMCIYYYQKTTNSWQMNYVYGNFDSHNVFSGSIFSETCAYGNLIRLNDFNEKKYLICYMKIGSSDLIDNVICQKFYIDNERLIIEQNYELWKDTNTYFKRKPIILYSYENSIIIEFDYHTSSMHYSRIILLSSDLKFNIHSNIYYI